MLRHGSAVGADLPSDEAVTVDAVADPPCGPHWPPPRPATPAPPASSRRGRYVRATGPGMCPRTSRAFFTLLEDAVPVISAADGLNPTDPVPWEVALTHARGNIQAPRDLRRVLGGGRRPRLHYGCHATALQYLCDKWYGSHEEMFAFASGTPRTRCPVPDCTPADDRRCGVRGYEVVSDDSTEDGPIGLPASTRPSPARWSCPANTSRATPKPPGSAITSR